MKPSLEPPPIPPSPAGQSAGERWLLALMAIFLLHMILFGAGGIVEAVSRRIDQPWRLLPSAPMRLVLISFLMAQCSLAAIAFGRARLASPWKALLLSGLAAGVWILLQVVAMKSEFQDTTSGSWLASLVTQGCLVACGVAAMDAFGARKSRDQRHQFTILRLLVWTTLAAAGLGGIRWLAAALGWSLDLRTWQYFYVLQTVGIFSAILALLLRTVVLHGASLPRIAGFAVLVSLATTTVFVVFVRRSFTEPGATALEMSWFMTGQALFLLAVLLPLRAALQPGAAELPRLSNGNHSTTNSATTG